MESIEIDLSASLSGIQSETQGIDIRTKLGTIKFFFMHEIEAKKL